MLNSFNLNIRLFCEQQQKHERNICIFIVSTNYKHLGEVFWTALKCPLNVYKDIKIIPGTRFKYLKVAWTQFNVIHFFNFSYSKFIKI